MRFLALSATGFEMAPLLHFLDEHAEKQSFFTYQWKNHTIHPLVTGVGSVNTALALARSEFLREVDFALQLGVAGAFNRELDLGTTVEVISDRFADLGVEEADGSFTDVYEMKLCPPDLFPFEKGWIRQGKRLIETGLIKTTGITVNKVHGTAASIQKIENKYKADLESMEGAAFFYACRLMDVKCIQMRAISNYVEPRNRDGWQLELAIDNLNREVINLIMNLPA